jgi:hypothetical protein
MQPTHLTNVVPFVFRKPINKKGSFASSIQDYYAKPARLAFPGPGDPLLDHASAKIGVDQAAIGVGNRVAHCSVIDTCASGKPGERFVLEYPHLP